MEMHQVRYFLALTGTLNFTRAAEECHVAQPSLTRAIKQLEGELGAELFRRERNLTHLTEFGHRMQPMLQQCYDSAASAKALASSLKKGAVAPLSLAISTAINLALLVPDLTELMRAFKGLELRFLRGMREQVVDWLKKGDAEVAVAGALGESWDRLDIWPLFTERLFLAVSQEHPLAGRKSIDLAELANERLLIRTYCELVSEFIDFFKNRQLQRRHLPQDGGGAGSHHADRGEPRRRHAAGEHDEDGPYSARRGRGRRLQAHASTSMAWPADSARRRRTH